jgi:hypothetical protein
VDDAWHRSRRQFVDAVTQLSAGLRNECRGARSGRARRAVATARLGSSSCWASDTKTEEMATQRKPWHTTKRCVCRADIDMWSRESNRSVLGALLANHDDGHG